MVQASVEQREDERDGPRRVAALGGDETPARFRSGGAVPRGFLGMLVLVFGLELCLEKVGRDYADLVVRDWQRSRNEIQSDLGGYQVLCFGDSQVKTGVVPQVIEGAPACELTISP